MTVVEILVVGFRPHIHERRVSEAMKEVNVSGGGVLVHFLHNDMKYMQTACLSCRERRLQGSGLFLATLHIRLSPLHPQRHAGLVLL